MRYSINMKISQKFVKLTVIFSLFSLLFSFLSASCASRIEGSLAANGSAALNVSISLEPRMTNLIRSLSAAGGQEGPALDGPAISQSMALAPGVASVDLRNTTPSAVEGTIRISNINQFLTPAEGRGFVNFTQAQTGGRCVINLNRTDGPAMIELLSPEISDYLNALMAPIASGEQLTKTEYLDLVASFYNRPLSDEIASSRIRASIDFPGTITNVRGGTFTGRRAIFDIPLLDLLVLETPLVYEVTWNN